MMYLPFPYITIFKIFLIPFVVNLFMLNCELDDSLTFYTDHNIYNYCSVGELYKPDSDLFSTSLNDYYNPWFFECDRLFLLYGLKFSDSALYKNMLIVGKGKFVLSKNYFDCLFFYRYDVSEDYFKKSYNLLSPLPINKMSFGNSFELNYPYLIIANYTCPSNSGPAVNFNECISPPFYWTLDLYKEEKENWKLKNSYSMNDVDDEELSRSFWLGALIWRGDWVVYLGGNGHSCNTIFLVKVQNEIFGSPQSFTYADLELFELNDIWLIAAESHYDGLRFLELKDEIWIEKQFISLENFGRMNSIEINNGWCAIGYGDNNPGIVTLYHVDGGIWNEAQSLSIHSADVKDGFGKNLLFSDDILYIGDGDGNIYTYKFDGSKWQQDGNVN